MKKITIISLHFGFGGIEKYISSLCKMFEKDYIVNIICVYKFASTPAFEFSDKINIKYLVEGNPKGNSLKKYLLSFQLLSFFKEIINRFQLFINSNKLLKKELRNISTDYLITTRIEHHQMVSKYVENKSIIKIATENNYHQNNPKYINGLKKSLIEFDYLVVPTKELYNFYKNIFNIQCVFIQNHLSNVPKEKTSFNNKNIISVGRFSEEKGFLDLIDVFSLVNSQDKNIKLYLLGDGHLSGKIKDKISELKLNDNIIMPGFVNEKDQKKYYLDSSLYIMTSFTEAFGLVLIEAMSYGLPCIAFDTASGPKEIITKENGILIKNRDKQKMADEIIKLLNDKNKLIKMQGKINISINNYNESTCMKNWKNILK